MIDAATVKEGIDCREFIARDLGDPVSRGASWVFPCPFHQEHTPGGFHVFKDGYKCYSCSEWGDVFDYVMSRQNLTFPQAVQTVTGQPFTGEYDQAAREARRAERERKAAEYAALDRAVKEKARQELDHEQAWKAYNDNLNDHPEQREAWHRRGLSDVWIDYFKVGYCPSKTFARDGKPVQCATLTIPSFRAIMPPLEPEMGRDLSWKCIALAHRIISPDVGGDKYRPHKPGLGKSLFYADLFCPDLFGCVLIVEGEIKAAVTYAHCFDFGYLPQLEFQNVLGVPGKSCSRLFADDWRAELAEVERFYLCFDPDANDEAVKAAQALGAGRCRIMHLPAKIDDLILAGALNYAQLKIYMKNARSI